MKHVEVYGWDLKRVAFLENAYNISYATYTTKLWTAQFSLPYKDKKRDFIQPFTFVKIWDVDGAGIDFPVGLFRVLPMVERDVFSIEADVTYDCEHVLSTLIDDVMIGFHEVGNRGIYTSNSISYILNNQSNKRWILGACDFNREFLYGWENENLLSALYSIPKPFGVSDYYWDFNTEKLPWVLSLKQVNPVPKTDIRYRKNLKGMSRTVDPRNLATRLYCYGSGEDDNVLNIASINNGLEYLESENVSKYGVITQVWSDERFKIQQSLLDAGKALLKRLESPEVTYEFELLTLPNLNVRIGDTVRVVTTVNKTQNIMQMHMQRSTLDLGNATDELLIVREYHKSDVQGAPLSGSIVIGNGTEDLDNSIAGSIERQRISDTYSQGAESLFMDSFADNADASNPAEINFIIPEGVVHINDMIINIKMEPFRVYSKSIASNEIINSTSAYAGNAIATSSEGGNTTVSSSSGGSSTPTSSAGGNTTATSSAGGASTATSSAGGSSTTTSAAGGGQNSGQFQTGTYSTLLTSGPVMSGTGAKIYDVGPATYSNEWHAGNASSPVGSTNNHRHALKFHTHKGVNWANHTHQYGLVAHHHTIQAHTHTVSIGNHTHSVSIGNHTHNVAIGSHEHTVAIPNHTHNVSIGAHSHTVSISGHTHSVTIPSHTHDLVHGIYLGTRASSYQVHVDNTYIGTYTSNLTNFNLIPYLKKDNGANGKILRGNHAIKITPNRMTRIEAWMQIRLFTQSRGSGQH